MELPFFSFDFYMDVFSPHPSFKEMIFVVHFLSFKPCVANCPSLDRWTLSFSDRSPGQFLWQRSAGRPHKFISPLGDKVTPPVPADQNLRHSAPNPRLPTAKDLLSSFSSFRSFA